MIEGASLAEVHHHWDHGTNIWAALTAGRQISVMSVAKVFVALAAITEGPLVQQASKISSRQVSNTMPLQVALAPNLPPGYTADVTGEFRVPTTPSGPFSSVFNDYSNRVPIAAGFDGCPGSCTAEVPGVGFKVTCEPATNTTWDLKQYSMGIGKPQFTASTSWRAMSPDGDFYIAPNGSYEYLTVSAGWAINTVDPLVFTSRYCNLSLAVVSYPIRIVNNTVSLSLPLNQNPTVLHDLPMAKTAPGMGSTGQTTLGGFKLIGEGPFFANVSMVANGAAALYSLYGLNPFTVRMRFSACPLLFNSALKPRLKDALNYAVPKTNQLILPSGRMPQTLTGTSCNTKAIHGATPCQTFSPPTTRSCSGWASVPPQTRHSFHPLSSMASH